MNSWWWSIKASYFLWGIYALVSLIYRLIMESVIELIYSTAWSVVFFFICRFIFIFLFFLFWKRDLISECSQVYFLSFTFYDLMMLPKPNFKSILSLTFLLYSISLTIVDMTIIPFPRHFFLMPDSLIRKFRNIILLTDILKLTKFSQCFDSFRLYFHLIIFISMVPCIHYY